VITARVGVAKNFGLNVVANAVSAAIDTVLRGRSFGQSLFESELDAAIEDIQGVAYWNVTIDGNFDSSTGVTTTSRLDSDGNLILTVGEIITKADFRDTTVTPSVAGVIVNPEAAITTEEG
jgi:hypothetical protein